ncbi:MAG: sulfite exporter TauE/SafE family protein [Vicinamibacterales bacterium]|nr:sulfite exporter TauE/SafE family protein [Vicinamibacterales bacterium]
MTGTLVAFAAAFAAGAINSVAGGGTLLTFPTLVWLGLPSIVANATSTVSIWPGSVGAMWGYRRELRDTDVPLWAFALPSLAGGLLGAMLLRQTPTSVFDRLVPALILFATLLFMAQEPIQRLVGHAPDRHRNPRWLLGAALFQFLVGLYGGYFGAGIGILMLAALGILGMRDIHQMNGVKNLLALAINGIASVYFVSTGMVRWTEVTVMAVGAIAGGIGGAGLARRAGRRVVRWVVIAIGFGMATSLALRP